MFYVSMGDSSSLFLITLVVLEKTEFQQKMEREVSRKICYFL